MKQKVQIDVLDVSLYDRGKNGKVDSIDESASPDSLKKKNYWGTLWKSKRILFSSCLIIIFLFLGFTFFFTYQYPSRIKRASVNKVAHPSSLAQPKLATLQDFIVNFKDRNGKERIFICALALEISPDKKLLPKEGYFEVRKIIYKKLINYCVDNLSLIHDKNRLKDDISGEINKQLGGNIVSRIYFTKFVIL